jgi:hypothetical protein
MFVFPQLPNELNQYIEDLRHGQSIIDNLPQWKAEHKAMFAPVLKEIKRNYAYFTTINSNLILTLEEAFSFGTALSNVVPHLRNVFVLDCGLVIDRSPMSGVVFAKCMLRTRRRLNDKGFHKQLLPAMQKELQGKGIELKNLYVYMTT